MDVIGTIFIAIMFAALIGIGLWGYKVSKKTMMDYACMGGAASYVILAAYAFTTGASVFTVMGIMGSSYNFGMPFLLLCSTPILHIMFTMVFIGSSLVAARELYGHYTPTQIIAGRYNSKSLQVFLAAFWYVAASIYITMQFVSVGVALAPFLGLSTDICALITAIVTLAYIMLGGLRAVAWTCVVYLVIMIVGYFAPFVLLVANIPIGDLAPLVNPLLLGSAGSVGYSYSLIQQTLTTNWFLVLGWPWMFYTAFASKNIKTLKQASFFSWVLLIIFFACSFIIGAVYGTALIPGLSGSAADTIFYRLLGQYLPNMGFELGYAVCIVAAALSTVATIIALQGVIAEADIASVLKKNLSEKAKINLSKLMSGVGVMLGFLIMLVMRLPVGLYWSAVLNPLFGMAVPTLFGLFWKRGNKYGAWASILTGLGLLILGLFVDFPFFYPRPTVLMVGIPALIGFPLCVVVYIAVSLLTPPTDASNVEKYTTNLRKWVKENS